ncbi:MAG: 2'-O-glycosyltransferase CruG [Spirulinaceae cyanobacterium]
MLTKEIIAAVSLVLFVLTMPGTLILVSRILKGAMRHPPLKPKETQLQFLGTVSVVIPTLNEAARIGPCLAGLGKQGYEVREIIVVDSNSQDQTQELVKDVATKDPRFRLINDPPLPKNWIGRPWALHNGFLASSPQSEWILGIDADTQPQFGLVASLLAVAEKESYDLISLSPQFILKYPGEWWLQPALLITLLYRFESAGVQANAPEQVMANGQCFFCRRSVLEKLAGYSSAKSSFCDDVTLARNIASQGFKVGFLDGEKILKVRMYEGAKETWQEWGRSLDLKDAASVSQTWGELWLLLMVQGLPLPLLVVLLSCLCLGYSSPSLIATIGLNLFLVIIRFALLLAIAPSYQGSSWLFWLSPFADPLAVARIFLSANTKPTQWRGRVY